MGLLGKITKGVQDRPLRVVIVSPEGVGKTTFAASAPNPIFIDVEDGSHQLDVQRFPVPETFEDVLACIKCLEEDDHDFKTVVIDTIDALENKVWETMCARDGVNSIEDYGYGKGYAKARDEFWGLLERLRKLSESKGMNVVLISHTSIRTVADPGGQDHDEYDLRTHKKVAGIVKEWSDVVGFANIDVIYTKDENTGRVKATATQSRTLAVSPGRGFTAKNRFGIARSLDFKWSSLTEAITEARANTSSALRAQAEDLFGKLPEEEKVKIGEKVKPIIAGDDSVALGKCVKRLEQLLAA